MSRIEEDLREIQKVERDGESAEERALRMRQEIVDRIRNGESTGDTIHDFVLVSYGGNASKQTELPYKKLDHKVHENIDGQVLVVQQRESIHGCPGISASRTIDPSFIGVNIILRLGIITGPLKFRVGEEITVPTEKYATRYKEQEKWYLEKGSITLSMFDLAGFGRTIEKRRKPMSNDICDFLDTDTFKSALNIYVGAEVEEYFRKYQRPLFRRNQKQLNLSYVDALQLLGEEVPKDFKEAYDKKRYDDCVSHITRIEKASTDEMMRCRLLEALDLGLHVCDVKYEQRPGITIDVPVYVTALCKQYGIDVPKK